MKKSNWIALMLCFLLLTGCAAGSSTASVKSFDEMTAEEQIETATDLDGVMACVKASEKRSSNYTAENEAALFEKIKTYLFTEGTLNGTYHYNEKFHIGTLGCDKYGLSLSYTLVVYCVSGDEIYLVPEEDAPVKVQDIPSMSNAARYRYQAVRPEGSLGFSSKDDGDCLFFTLQRHRATNIELEISYYAKSNLLNISGKIPQQSGEWPFYQEYYADWSTSYSTSKAEYDEWEAEKAAEKAEKGKLAKSAPTVGMTKEEVEGCAWGKPDKKNIDEYAWGTSEQWVYRSKGYVYFKNGIVSSVSKR